MSTGSCNDRGANCSWTAGIGQGPTSSDPREGTTSSGTPIDHSELEAGAGNATSSARDRKVGERPEQRDGNFKQMHYRQVS